MIEANAKVDYTNTKVDLVDKKIDTLIEQNSALLTSVSKISSLTRIVKLLIVNLRHSGL